MKFRRIIYLSSEVKVQNVDLRGMILLLPYIVGQFGVYKTRIVKCCPVLYWVSFWGHSYLLLRFPMQPHTLSMEGHARTSVAGGMRSA